MEAWKQEYREDTSKDQRKGWKRLTKEQVGKVPRKEIVYEMLDVPKEMAGKFIKMAIEGNHLAEPGVTKCSLESLFLWRIKGEEEWFLDSIELVREFAFEYPCRDCGTTVKSKKKLGIAARICKECYQKRYVRKCDDCNREFKKAVGNARICPRCRKRRTKKKG